ncbi:E3 SUMO-protein ligase ZBED1-like [Triplophysa rosa]|nr:E3 SUMO-protein ligase ZBED1-like [Triplophysa rosa]
MASEGDKPQIEPPPASYKSAVWEHFGFPIRYSSDGHKNVDKTVTVCKICMTRVPYSQGNTTNMTGHLRRHHPRVDSSRAQVRPKQFQQHTLPSAFKQPLSSHSDKHKTITKALGVFIAKDIQPYSVVDDAGFQHLIKTLEPRYEIPSRAHFSSKIIPELYDETRSKIENKLANAKHVALTTDSWTSRATESYLTVTAHYISDWQLESAVLQTCPLFENHTSSHLADALMSAVTDWKLERPNITIPVTTDNARNMVNAIKEAAGLGPQIGCFAHILNLAAKKAVALQQTSRLLGKVRKVVAFFHKSTTAANALKVKQEMLNIPAHKLIHDTPTRWNTIYDMMERYLEQQPAIYSALMDKNIKKNVKDIAVLSDSELTLAEEMIQLLKPLKTTTTLLSTETAPSLSMVLPLKTMILKSMDPADHDSPAIKDAKAAISEDLKSRYTDPDLQDYLNRASFLDPRFKSLPNLDAALCLNVCSGVIREIIEQQGQPVAAEAGPSGSQNPPESPPVKKSAMSELFGDFFRAPDKTKTFDNIVEEEVMSYKAEDSIDTDAYPLAWWELHESKYPHVAKLAKQYLCVCATSVPSERVFSTAGDIVSASRSRLATENVNKLIFLQKNMKI